MEEPNAGTTTTPTDDMAARAVLALERIASALERTAGLDPVRHEHWDEGQSPEDRAAGIAAANALKAEGQS